MEINDVWNKVLHNRNKKWGFILKYQALLPFSSCYPRNKLVSICIIPGKFLRSFILTKIYNTFPCLLWSLLGDWSALWISFTRALIPLGGLHPLELITSQRPLLLTQWALRFNIWTGSGGGTFSLEQTPLIVLWQGSIVSFLRLYTRYCQADYMLYPWSLVSCKIVGTVIFMLLVKNLMLKTKSTWPKIVDLSKWQT